VTSVLRRLGLNRLKTLEAPAPVIRYERERPELLHLDTDGIGHRITGRGTGAINRHHGIGWEHLHVCIDDASRLAYTEILADERKETAIAFLKRALAWFATASPPEGVMTDNGAAYISRDFQAA
jgi:transposase InsO family protein